MLLPPTFFISQRMKSIPLFYYTKACCCVVWNHGKDAYFASLCLCIYLFFIYMCIYCYVGRRTVEILFFFCFAFVFFNDFAVSVLKTGTVTISAKAVPLIRFVGLFTCPSKCELVCSSESFFVLGCLP